MGDEIAWVTGRDPDVIYRKHIDSGGVGDVHELLSKSRGKSFARKIIRLGGTVGKADVENEAQVASLILMNGGHGNIITILSHGWLKYSFNQCYYIDMELCEFNLRDYVNYHYNQPTVVFETNIEPNLSPTVVRKDSSIIERMQNTWTIGIHIALGLEFMHSTKQAHRDLKPGNVLYCRYDNRWKLTDFGISAKASSTRAFTTVYSKGTSSYRAPELLAEHAAFITRVDIWALGCILHELVTGTSAFHQDWAVRQYFEHEGDLPISLLSFPPFLRHHVSGIINDLLKRDWNQRPSASEACSIFVSYSHFLELAAATIVLDANTFPVYSEWKALVERRLSKGEFFSQLSSMFEQKGDSAVAQAIRQDMVRRLWSRHEAIAAESVDLLSLSSRPLSVENISAIQLSQPALEDGFWLWHDVCCLNIQTVNFDAAIRACNDGNTRFPLKPWPILALSNVYALKGDYHEAILAYMKFFSFRKEDERRYLDGILTQRRQQVVASDRTDNVNMNEPYSRDLASSSSLKSWVSKRASDLERIQETGGRLNFAAWTGDVTQVRSILSNETPEKIESQTSYDYTPLHLAVWNLHSDVVQALLSVNDIATWISEAGPQRWTPLHFAAWNNDVHTIQELLKAGAMSSPHDKDGWTPLHLAANRGNLDAIRQLVRGGANVTAVENNGWTAMHRAAIYDHTDIIETLIEAGADVCARSSNGSCPIHWAAVAGRSGAITSLIRSGADVSAKENYGWMPLHRASTYGHLDAVKLLLDAGADISAPSDTGATALHWAAENGHVPVVLWLINAGASVLVRDGMGWTPMHRAATFGHGGVIKELIRSGADFDSRDNDGRTPLRWAANLGHVDSTEILKAAGAHFK